MMTSRAMGDYFASLLRGSMKMGDSPSVGSLLRGTPEAPSMPGWGGSFVRLWEERKRVFNRLTTAADEAEVFGVVEFALPVPAGFTKSHTARMVFDGRIPAVGANEGGVLRFRFSPRDAKVWPYAIESDLPAWSGQRGAFTAAPPAPDRTQAISKSHPHWWIDDPDPGSAEGVHPGARTVNRWREDFLRDFAARLDRYASPPTR